MKNIYIVVSVSYTHLDVYKRQGERSPRRKASLKKKAKKSKRNKWLLAAAVGSSGYVDSFLNTDMSYGCLLYTSRCV